MRKILFGLLVVGAALLLPMERSRAQTPAPKPAPAAAARTAPRAATSSTVVEATLAQLMRGILFPDSNVIFAAQSDNPADVPPAKDPATATNPLASTYGKWTAVENSGLAIAESANLLSLPGRKCSNGLAVPIGNADWAKFVQGVRDAGMQAYKAAQSKDQDKILEAAGNVSDACSNCHERYRDKGGPAERCK
jgi:Cytochrome C'